MKKLFSVLSVIILTLTLFSSCNNTGNEINNDKLTVITTIFPEYDWIMNLTKDVENIDVTMLLDNGVDLHSYQPSATDLVKISDCDLFVFIGGNSDLWVNDALKSTNTSDINAVNLMEVLKNEIKEEELVSGMQAEEEEEEENGDVEYDEHIWLSLKNTKKIITYLADKLSEIDSENKNIYERNRDTYLKQLDELDNSYTSVIENSKRNTILVADRFPFRYLTDDYSINYYAAFAGCNTESNASFETISFLAEKVDELKLDYIITLENSNSDIAQTVSDTSKNKPQIAVLNSMQSTTLSDYNNGESYLSIAKKNLEILKTVLL